MSGGVEGLGRVTDSHVHLLPGRLGDKVREFFAPIADVLAYPIDHGEVCRRLASEGVDQAWHLPYAHRPGIAEGLNEASRTTSQQQLAVDIIGGATVHPADDDPVGIVTRALDVLGLRVLKLHSSVGRFDADDPRLDGVWALACERRLPVVVHAGHPVDGQTPSHDLAPIARVAERFPLARIVIAHAGLPATDRALDLLDAHEHVHADLTPVMTQAPELDPERVAAAAPKLLFGTDAPNTGIRAAEHLASVAALPMPPDLVDLVIGGNARRLTDEVAA